MKSPILLLILNFSVENERFILFSDLSSPTIDRRNTCSSLCFHQKYGFLKAESYAPKRSPTFRQRCHQREWSKSGICSDGIFHTLSELLRVKMMHSHHVKENFRLFKEKRKKPRWGVMYINDTALNFGSSWKESSLNPLTRCSKIILLSVEFAEISSTLFLKKSFNFHLYRFVSNLAIKIEVLCADRFAQDLF